MQIKSTSERGKPRPKTIYKGVYWAKGQGKYMSKLQYKGKTYIQAYYDTIEEAVRARDLTIMKNNLPLPLQKFKKQQI